MDTIALAEKKYTSNFCITEDPFSEALKFAEIFQARQSLQVTPDNSIAA